MKKNFTRVWALFLAFMLALSLYMPAFAEEPAESTNEAAKASGITEWEIPDFSVDRDKWQRQYVKWTLDAGVLTVEPAQDGMTGSNDPTKEQKATVTEIIIKDGVTVVERFYDYTQLKKITFADSVTHFITGGVFSNCPNLTDVTLPKNLTSLENGFFEYCKSLKTVKIPETVTIIGKDAFRNCEQLETIVIPKSVTKIDQYAFIFCTSLRNVTIPESVKEIGESAFAYCENLSDINLPEGLTSIGNGAFSGCNSLVTVEIPDTVTELGEYVFSDCEKLTNVKISQNATTIPYNFFSHCENLSKIDMPETLKSIGEWAFSVCKSLKEVNLPEGLTSIGAYAFSSCEGLNQIVLPKNLTEIGKNAFYHCDNLRELSVAEGNSAFKVTDYGKVLLSADGEDLYLVIGLSSGSSKVYNVPDTVKRIKSAVMGNYITAVSSGSFFDTVVIP